MKRATGKSLACAISLCALLLPISLGCAARPKKVTLSVPASHPVRVASVEMENAALAVVAEYSGRIDYGGRMDHA